MVFALKKDVGFQGIRSKAMVSSIVSSVAHAHVHIPSARLHDLADEVRKNGVEAVVRNRACRAEEFHKLGDEEFAQQEAREAAFVLDVYA